MRQWSPHRTCHSIVGFKVRKDVDGKLPKDANDTRKEIRLDEDRTS